MFVEFKNQTDVIAAMSAGMFVVLLVCNSLILVSGGPETTPVLQSTFAAPTNGATSTNPASVGPIVGGAVRGIAIIVAGLIAFLFLRRRKQLVPTPPNTVLGTIMSGTGLL